MLRVDSEKTQWLLFLTSEGPEQRALYYSEKRIQTSSGKAMMQIVSCFEGLDSQYTNISCSLIDISQIKSHVYGKQQTSICSARNHFFLYLSFTVYYSNKQNCSFRPVACIYESYRKSSIEPPGALIYFKPIWGEA